MRKGITGMGEEYRHLLADVGGIITRGHAAALRQITVTQVITYWLVGGRIVEYYQSGKRRAGYGEQVLSRLSCDLKARFGKGYSVDSLQNMRRFYVEFPKLLKIYETSSRKFKLREVNEKHGAVPRILPWSHYCELLKEDDLSARSFYEIEAFENGWSLRELRRQMDAMLYERLALSRNKKMVKAMARRGQVIENPEDAVKDPLLPAKSASPLLTGTIS